MIPLLNFVSIIMLNLSSQTNGVTLLDSQIMKNDNRWRIVNDDVMGGSSSSQVSVNQEDKIVFSGKVSLKNNGGFASLRSSIKDYRFEQHSGIEIHIKGDGKKYSLSMKETSSFTGSFYTAMFKTVKDDWLIVKIPFKSFALYYFGREVRSDPRIPLNRIKEVSLLIGEKQEGPFNAEIDFIRLY
jgi:hypothetical protein